MEQIEFLFYYVPEEDGVLFQLPTDRAYAMAILAHTLLLIVLSVESW